MSEEPIKSKTDLDRIDRMKDEDIDYSDIPPLGDEFFTKPTVATPGSEEDETPPELAALRQKNFVELCDPIRGLADDIDFSRNPSTSRDTRPGADLIDALQSSPHRDTEIEPERYRVLNPLPPSLLEWLKQQRLRVAEVFRRSPK